MTLVDEVLSPYRKARDAFRQAAADAYAAKKRGDDAAAFRLKLKALELDGASHVIGAMRIVGKPVADQEKYLEDCLNG